MHFTRVIELILCLISMSLQIHASPLAKHTKVIENYIMKGYGKGWKLCDVLSIEPPHPRFEGEKPGFIIGLTALRGFDISSRLKQSSCLLLTAHIPDLTTLSMIIEFGWSVIQHKRLAIVMTMGPNITLGMAKNITNLPYMIATELHDGRSQFLCPKVGKHILMQQTSMCVEPLADPMGEKIRVGVHGPWPWVIPGGQDGVDIRLLKFLEDKLEFKAQVEQIKTFDAAFDMVNSHG